MTEPNAKLIDKLRKLQAHAESAQAIGSEAEAQAFAEMFQRMLLENKLEMTDIQFSQYEETVPIESAWVDYRKYPGLEFKARRIKWMEDLAAVIAAAHFCRILVRDRSNLMTFVGRREDIKVCEFMFVTLVRALGKMADSEYSSYSVECVKQCANCRRSKTEHKKIGADLWCPYGGEIFEPNWARCRGFKASYMEGFITRLFNRYQELRRAKEANTTALVRFNRSDEAVNDWMKKKNIPKADNLKETKITNTTGYRRGVQAADSINLQPNALEADQRKQLP